MGICSEMTVETMLARLEDIFGANADFRRNDVLLKAIRDMIAVCSFLSLNMVFCSNENSSVGRERGCGASSSDN